MEYDRISAEATDVVFSDEDLDEGAKYWKHSLVACVVGSEVSSPQMDRFVKAKWTGIVPPTIVKQAGVFIFTFDSHEDLSKVYEAFTCFIFDKPLLLKRLEPGMRIGNICSNEHLSGYVLLICVWIYGLLGRSVN